MKSSIIIPTYNENGNIQTLVEKILNLKLDLDIVIIDDNSPDGTGKLAEELAQKNAKVHVIHRFGQRGAGLSLIDGFKYLAKREVDYIIQMDADLSHDPLYIPQFLENIKKYDVVIGSRYIKGGRNYNNSFWRKIISKLGNLYIRLVLGLWEVKDTTSGYRCFRKEVLENIGLDTLTSTDPALISEMLYKCKGYAIKEIPIIYRDRKFGKSKLCFSILLRYLIKIICWRLEINTHFIEKGDRWK